MKQVSVSEAQSEFLQLIAAVEASGEPVSIVRDGLSIVEIVPSRMSRQARAKQAVQRISALSECISTNGEDWMQWRHEGHRY